MDADGFSRARVGGVGGSVQKTEQGALFGHAPRRGRVRCADTYALLAVAPIDQGAEMRAAFMSIERAFVTYSEGMTLASQNAEPGDPGACRRR
jgi:hypothetical protein